MTCRQTLLEVLWCKKTVRMYQFYPNRLLMYTEIGLDSDLTVNCARGTLRSAAMRNYYATPWHHSRALKSGNVVIA